MSHLTILARRALALYRVRALEITLQGQIDARLDVRSAIERAALEESIKQLRRDLAKARANYSGLLPIGKRTVWSMA